MRRVLAVLMLLCFALPAHAAPTTLSTSSRDISFIISADNLTVSSGGHVYVMAHDIDGDKVWWWSAFIQKWNNDVLSNQNPQGAVGGVSTTALAAGPYFPMGGLFDTNSNVHWIIPDVDMHGDKPASYSTWTTLAGATTWNNSDKGTGLVLANGNLSMSKTSGSGSALIRGTTSLTTGSGHKVLLGWNLVNPSSNNFYPGIGNSSVVLNGDVPGTTTNGMNDLVAAGIFFLNGNTGITVSDSVGASYYTRAVLGTNSVSTGKKVCIEATVNSNTPIAQRTAIGFAEAAFPTRGTMAGESATSFAAQTSSTTNTVRYNSADIGLMTIWTAGETNMVCINTTTNKIWVKNQTTGLWNVSATADPATDTEGYSFSGISYPILPVITMGDYLNNSSLTLNFGATAPANALPSGFVMLDTALAGRSRGWWFTQAPVNDNSLLWRDNGRDACEWAA